MSPLCRLASISCGLCLAGIALLSACNSGSLDLLSPGTNDGADSLKADLSPGPVEAPRSLRLDELLQMDVVVNNAGRRTAGPGWVIRVLLSRDSQIDTSDQQIDQFVTTRELTPGAQDRYLRNKKLSGVLPGDYYIGSILDVTGVVPETNEENNRPTGAAIITLEGSDEPPS